MAMQDDDGPRGFVPKSEHYKALQRIEALEEELRARRLDDRVGASQDQIGWLRVRLGLSLQQATILAAVVSANKPAVARDYLCDLAGVPDDKQIGVVVWNINGKLQRMGAPPHTLSAPRGSQSVGYSVKAEGLSWIRHHVPEAFADKGASR
jgi:hypothetical protein